MTPRVRQGLGLLVVAAIGGLVANTAKDAAGSAAGSIVYLIGWLGLAVGLFVGLGLLAWGLIRGT